MLDSDHIVKRILKATYSIQPRRADAYIHASELTDPNFCPRKKHLMRKHKREEFQTIGSALQITFDMGKATQSLINNRWLRPVMWGDWVCRSCRSEIPENFAPTTCPNCPSGSFIYQERKIRAKPYKVTGSVDGFVLHQGELIPLECKIITPNDFKTMKAPKAEHTQRTRLYLELIHKYQKPPEGLTFSETAVVLYVSRAYGIYSPVPQQVAEDNDTFSPLRQFTVQRNDPLNGKMWELAQEYADSSPDKPCRGICDSINDETAQGCPVKAECFRGD